MKKIILVAVMTAVALPVMRYHHAVGHKQTITNKQRSTPRQVQKKKKDFNLIPGSCVFFIT
jgi:hypothetical protein